MQHTKDKDKDKEEKKPKRRTPNMCPEHGIRLISTYYEDLDMLLFKCIEEFCEEGHIIEEHFKARKERRHQFWVKKEAQKIIDGTVITMEPAHNR